MKMERYKNGDGIEWRKELQLGDQAEELRKGGEIKKGKN